MSLDVTSSEGWAHSFEATADRLTFRVDPNDSEPGSDPRQATLTIRYPGAETVEAVIRQAAPELEEPDPLTFSLSIARITPSTVFIDCIPSDAQATYILRTISKSDYDAYAGDDELIASDIEFFRQPVWGSDLPGDIANYLLTGAKEAEPFTILSTDPYYVYAYGLTAAGEVTSDLFKQEYTAPPRPEIEITQPDLFPVEGGTFRVGYTIVNPLDEGTIEITPSTVDWIHDIEVVGDEISFTIDPNTAAEPGSEPRESHFNVSYPEAYNQFVKITQAAPEEILLEFDLQVTSCTPSELHYICTPTDLEATYVLRLTTKSDYDALGSDEELIASDIEYFLQPGWTGEPGRIADYLVKGVQEDYFSVYDTAPRYLYAYGLTEDGTATTPVTKIEVTPPPRPVIHTPAFGTIPAEGGTFEVTYTIENPIGDTLPTIETAWGLEWAHDFVVAADRITFVVDSNAAAEPGSSPRTSFFRIKYPDAYDKVISLNQLAPELP